MESKLKHDPRFYRYNKDEIKELWSQLNESEKSEIVIFQDLDKDFVSKLVDEIVIEKNYRTYHAYLLIHQNLSNQDIEELVNYYSKDIMSRPRRKITHSILLDLVRCQRLTSDIILKIVRLPTLSTGDSYVLTDLILENQVLEKEVIQELLKIKKVNQSTIDWINLSPSERINAIKKYSGNKNKIILNEERGTVIFKSNTLSPNPARREIFTKANFYGEKCYWTVFEINVRSIFFDSNDFTIMAGGSEYIRRLMIIKCGKILWKR